MMLTFKGTDSWDRPVYEDENGCLLVDTDPRKGRIACLCAKLNNEFDGEPDVPVRVVEKYSEEIFEFNPCRVTW